MYVAVSGSDWAGYVKGWEISEKSISHVFYIYVNKFWFFFLQFQIFMHSPWMNQQILFIFKHYNQTGFYIWIYLFLTKKKTEQQRI